MTCDDDAARSLRGATGCCAVSGPITPPAGAAAPGLRRTDDPARRAEALADRWGGLPPGVTRWRLAAALRAAARPLRLSAGMLRLIEHYIDLSYDRDWAADSEPVICRPLVETAEALSLSERQVRNLERGLLERGLLAFRDSGNHHRRGRRDRREGRLVYAYGPTLAPLGARAAEIIDLAAAARGEIAEARRRRLAISALRRRLRADLAAAAEAGLDVADLSRAFAVEPDRMPAGLSLTALDSRRDALATLATRLDAQFGVAGRSTASREIDAKPEILSRHIPDTVNQHSMNGYSTATRHRATTAPVRAQPQRHHPDNGRAEPRRRRDDSPSETPLKLALAAAGPLIGAQALATATASGRTAPVWSDLVEAARLAAPLLGLRQDDWGAACGALGRSGAALAAILIERGLDRREAPDAGDEAATGHAPIRAPAAYLRALTARATMGTLRMDRSIRALARRSVDAAAAPPRAERRLDGRGRSGEKDATGLEDRRWREYW